MTSTLGRPGVHTVLATQDVTETDKDFVMEGLQTLVEGNQIDMELKKYM